MDERFVRSAMLLGKENIERLRTVKVAVFGIGGVGSFVCEALARCGVGNFVLVDNDTVDITNINRQLIALKSTLGKSKVDVMEDRIKDIYEFAAVTKYKCFYLSDTADEIDLAGCDYIVDAVDTVSAKIEIVMRAEKLGIPVISSMGMGSRLNPSKIEVADIKKTHTCPLAKAVRKGLRDRGIEKLKAAYSTEHPVRCSEIRCGENEKYMKYNSGNDAEVPKRHMPQGSVSFVPSTAGLIIAGEVINSMIVRQQLK